MEKIKYKRGGGLIFLKSFLSNKNIFFKRRTYDATVYELIQTITTTCCKKALDPIWPYLNSLSDHIFKIKAARPINWRINDSLNLPNLQNTKWEGPMSYNFFKWADPGLFLFVFVLFKRISYRKNCRLLRDSNSDCQSRRLAQ